MNRQKILIFNWRDTKHTAAGGAEIYVREIAKRLVATYGYDVTIFCGNDGHCKTDEVVGGVHIMRRGNFYTVFFWAPYYYFFHLKKIGFSAVFESQNGIPFFTPLYVRSETKLFCLIHHIHTPFFKRYLPWPQSVIAVFLETVLMPLVYRKTHCITISESTKNELEKMIKQKNIPIIHCGVSSLLSPREKTKNPTILYLGRLKKYKSVDLLVEAMNSIRQDVPTAHLTIAGDGSDRGRLQNLVNTFTLESVVTFAGKVSEDEKKKLLGESWVFVNPSYLEGWGISIIEANACGTPAIGFDTSGLRNSIQDDVTGYRVTERTSHDLAKKILLLLSDDTDRQKKSQAAIMWAKNFSWDKSAEQFAALIS